jgi:hypothetical protein
MNIYTDCKIYGHYVRKDGRKHVCVIFSDGSRKTVSYPKYLLEVHLNRYLNDDETVDHIDRDFNNNDIYNLRIIDRRQHAIDDAKRVDYMIEATCVWCNTYMGKINHLNRSKNRTKAGPFCSKECIGQYGSSVQNGGKKLEKPLYKKRYYYNNKEVK